MQTQRQRILFASSHCPLDCASGAALATMDLLRTLVASGFACRGFCASKLDAAEPTEFEQLLLNRQLLVQHHDFTLSDRSVRLLHVSSADVPITSQHAD